MPAESAHDVIAGSANRRRRQLSATGRYDVTLGQVDVTSHLGRYAPPPRPSVADDEALGRPPGSSGGGGGGLHKRWPNRRPTDGDGDGPGPLYWTPEMG